MAETTTIRVFKSDKERLQEIAEATDLNTAEIVAEFIRQPAYVCPECGEPFDPEEIDRETLEEHGLLTTGVDKLVKGQRDVKSFECPCCGERIRPKDIEAVDGGKPGYKGVTRSDIGVTPEPENPEWSTEQE
jgi:predicted RNA-binding Zn-ribbon protein involved in translation (DUF1610 family)